MREGAFEVPALMRLVDKTRRVSASHIAYGEQSRNQEKALRERPRFPTAKDVHPHLRSSEGTEYPVRVRTMSFSWPGASTATRILRSPAFSPVRAGVYPIV